MNEHPLSSNIRPHNTRPAYMPAREEEAAEAARQMLKEGKGPASKNAGGAAAAIAGVGLARAAGVADLEAKEAKEDERYLRKVRLIYNLRCLRVMYVAAVSSVASRAHTGTKAGDGGAGFKKLCMYLERPPF